MTENRLTDLTYLNDISMGDDSLVIEMVELFLENAPPTMENLKSHESEGNWEKLAAEAHKFKPTLSYMGMEDAKQLLIEIEQDAKKGTNLETIDTRIEELQSYCQKAYGELQSKLKQMQGG